MTVCKLATPSSGDRMLVIEPGVKRPIEISVGRRSGKTRQGDEQERDEPQHAFGL
jgi:hypothetical protein